MAAIIDTPVIQKTFNGWPLGLNLAAPPQEIPDTMARYIQDGLLDQVGVLRRRGAVKPVANTPVLTGEAKGVIQTTSPDGSVRVCVITGVGSNVVLNVLSSDYSTVEMTETITSATDTVDGSGELIVQSSPTTTIGSVFTIADAYQGVDANAYRIYWAGAGKPRYYQVSSPTQNYTGSGNQILIGGTSPIDMTTVVEPGTFVFSANTATGHSGWYLGVVTAVTSSSVTLDRPLPGASFGIFTDFVFQPFRGLFPMVASGRITCAAGGTQVVGAGTDFGNIAPSTTGLAWDLFTADTDTYICTIDGVNGVVVNATNLRLQNGQTANVDVSNGAYYAKVEGYNGANINGAYDYGANATFFNLGVLTATYSGYQFYANSPTDVDQSEQLWFSNDTNFESVNINKATGDFTRVTSQTGVTSPITALAGLQNALAIFKDQELFALYGTDPTNFQIKKIADVGTWSAMSVQTFQNSVVFASRNGIYAFDGVKLKDLSGPLGNEWKDGVKTDDQLAWSMLFHNHYILYVDGYLPTYQVQKGFNSYFPSKRIFCLDLDSGAFTTFTNVSLRGAITLPSSTQKGTWFVCHDSVPHTYLCDATLLWSAPGSDSFACAGEVIGPDFYLETKALDMGDGARKKFFKHVIMSYLCADDTLSMDTVPGLSGVGSPTATQWNEQFTTAANRIKFLKRDTHLAFRLYETDGSASDVQIGPWSIGYKWMRIGRV